jgi:predicted nucleotidyltransferase
MDKCAALETIMRFRESLERRGIRVSKLVLFGSFARGDFQEGSDIDVVVISDDFSGKGYWQRIELLSDAIYEVFAPLEAVGMTRHEWETGASIIVDYAREGEVVYAA